MTSVLDFILFLAFYWSLDFKILSIKWIPTETNGKIGQTNTIFHPHIRVLLRYKRTSLSEFTLYCSVFLFMLIFYLYHIKLDGKAYLTKEIVLSQKQTSVYMWNPQLSEHAQMLSWNNCKFATSEHKGSVRNLWRESILLDQKEMGLGRKTETKMEIKLKLTTK